MKKNSLFILAFTAWSCQNTAQTVGTVTPERAANLSAAPIEIPPKYQAAFPTARGLQMPSGFKAKVFYAGNLLSKPRFMAWSPDSILHIANKSNGNIVAMPDRNRDGVADTAFVAAGNLVGAHSLQFFRNALYVALQRQVIKLTDVDGNGIYETRTVFIDNIAGGAQQPGGGHDTRTIVFDEIAGKMYLSIGSLCNVCRETDRGIIEEYDLNGQNRRIYATGIRNAVGMTLHPVTNRLWANTNGSDNQGNDIPPEWIDLVRDGGYYGYPFVHSFQRWFNFNQGADYRALLPITAADSALVRRQMAPAALVQAHSAQMALQFSNTSFPSAYRNGLWTVYRGSWNRSPPTGYKLVFLGFENAQDTTADYVTDVVTGILNASGTAWARPVGLALDKRGGLYLGSDDLTQCVLSIQTSAQTAVVETPKLLDFQLSPNPVTREMTLDFAEFTDNSPVQVEVFNVLGKLVFSAEMRSARQVFNLPNLSSGVYTCRLSLGNRLGLKKMMVVN
jgi:glucose/arabinose dehydrogenase